ncbi:MAG TPA: glycoside hydrolase family 3 N-terminal domain-containing protein [Candidatus Krumholzibacteria bacterium]|nr:glycoside hydrolase family 3 N-terminal domain-containing protein [Candidatus Krumholzibacteria bacterium]HPD71070.1 glycoside hydrolase family 3 N-terminal domain-containing protein [Candidatus Krumholzibacteria bacterium]HRY39230.1 glycoside hydrolase family 3 N-terminal domain-containing protein [Candidatus Krumholzibacteria bacterium]
MNEPSSPFAARLIVGLAGASLDPRERDWFARWRPAGVILFARNCRGPEQLRGLVRDLRAVLPADAEICADHEGGAVSFLQAAAGRPPSPRTLGDLDDPDLTRRVHEQTGRRLRDLGLDRVLAPCCDVLREARNPVIGSRAFAADPERVARHAAAAYAGLSDAGLAACAKHWPGHGSTRGDTHDDETADVAADDADREPFRAVLAAGADALMVGHLPAAPRRPPLTVDGIGLADLRRAVGPRVRIYSDDVSMGALRPALAARGVEAGDGRSEGLVDPGVLTASWLEAIAGAGSDRLLLRGIPWRALPLADGAAGPALPALAPALDLARCGPDAPAYAEARRRAAAGVTPRPGPGRLLWLDATAGDRLGEASALGPALSALWPDLVRLDSAAARLAPGRAFARVLVTSHRPLTLAHAGCLEPQLAAAGEALVAGHPSLGEDLARLAGPLWRVSALRDLSGPDLGALAAAP